MSFSLADSTGILDEFASIGGLTDFVDWAQAQTPTLRNFVRRGYTEDLEELKQELVDVPIPMQVREQVLAIRAVLAAAEDVLIITDGMSDAPRILGGAGSGNYGHAGRPGEVGGSAPSITPEDLDLSPYAKQDVQRVKEAGNYQLTLKEKAEGWGETRYTFAIEPKNLPARIETGKGGFKNQDTVFYDPTLAEPVPHEYFEGSTAYRLKSSVVDELESSEAGYLYRGMSYGEWEKVQQGGKIESTGEYNLGDQQKGHTYFSTDIAQAAHYASGFAPWQFKPSFDRPAVVVKIKDPGNALVMNTERGIPGSVSLADVTAIFEAHPYAIQPGFVEYYKDSSTGGKYSEGSRKSPSAQIVWKKRGASTRALGGPGSGNFGHAGRPGQVGGSFSFGQTRQGPSAVTLVRAKQLGYTEGPYYHASDFATKIAREGFLQKGAEKWELQDPGSTEDFRMWGSASPTFLAKDINDVIEVARHPQYLDAPSAEEARARGWAGGQEAYGSHVVTVYAKPGTVKDASEKTLAGGFFVSDPQHIIPIKGTVKSARLKKPRSLRRRPASSPILDAADAQLDHLIAAVSLGFAAGKQALRKASKKAPPDAQAVVRAMKKAWATVLPSALRKTLHAGGEAGAELLVGRLTTLGGPGSGHFGHSGRPGEVGGSASSGSAVSDRPRSTDTPAFKRWFKDSKVVDAEGDPQVVYHGTTHGITEFAPAGSENLNPESDFGAAAYFSNSPEDVSENYAGIGPDLTSRIEQRADEIESELTQGQGGIGKTYVTKVDEYGNEYGVLEEGDQRKEAMAQARAELVGEAKALIIPAYLSMQNPYVLGKDATNPVPETVFTFEYEYEDPNDLDSDIVGEKGTLVDFMTAVREEASNFNDTEGVEDFLQQVSERGLDGITASELDALWRKSEKLSYVTDDNGRLVGNELYRAALERAGFDGVIDRSVNVKFGSERRIGRQMVGMQPGTTHYVVFKPNQVKSAGGNVGTFDPTRNIITLGGPGSGHFGHSGRPGEVGGSSSSGGAVIDRPITDTKSPEFKQWFGDSEVVDAQGHPKTMYHAASGAISEFRPFTHFGTVEAANDRANILSTFYEETLHRSDRSEGSNVIPVYLKVENPLRMPDLAGIDSNTGEPLPENWDDAGPDDDIKYPRGWEGEEAIATTLLEMGIIDINEFEEHRNNYKALELLKEKGYDGIVYENIVEDPGSESWIVFDHTQVRSKLSGRMMTAFRTAKRDETPKIDFAFDVKSQAAIDWADKHAGELVTNIGDTTQEAINNATAEYLETGDWDEYFDEILAAVGDEDRARLIARNEAMIAVHEGQREAWDQAVEQGLLTGDEEREWIIVGDDKVCKICEGLEGKRAKFGEKYTSDEDGEEYDGPPAHVNCRCSEGIV